MPDTAGTTPSIFSANHNLLTSLFTVFSLLFVECRFPGARIVARGDDLLLPGPSYLEKCFDFVSV